MDLISQIANQLYSGVVYVNFCRVGHVWIIWTCLDKTDRKDGTVLVKFATLCSVDAIGNNRNRARDNGTGREWISYSRRVARGV